MKKTINDWCLELGLKNYVITDDGVVNVNGDVNISNRNLTEIPIQFGIVTGCFDCYNNKLTSLEGCPEEVGADLYCYNNKLTSLWGCPKKIGETFDCSNNELTSLKGCPKELREGFFDCRNNKLLSLEGGPNKVGGSYDCSNNKLTSLEGYPEEYDGYFICVGNPVYEEFSKYDNYKHYIRSIKLNGFL